MTLDLADSALVYKPVKKDFTNIADYVNEVITLERNIIHPLLLKFEDKNMNPALFIKASVKVGSADANQLIGDIFGNIVLNNTPAGEKIEITLNDDRFKPL